VLEICLSKCQQQLADKVSFTSIFFRFFAW
jgi:hypothetical protein